MNMYTTSALAAEVDGRAIGEDMEISSVSSLADAEPGQVAFVDDQKLFDAALSSRASCLIVSPEFVSFSERSETQSQVPALIEVPKPKLAFARIAALLHPPKTSRAIRSSDRCYRRNGKH